MSVLRLLNKQAQSLKHYYLPPRESLTTAFQDTQARIQDTRQALQ